MKTKNGWLQAWQVVLVASGVACTGQAQNAGWRTSFDYNSWYLRSGIGPEFTQNSEFSLDSTQPDARVKFDPGLRVDFAGGYQFTPYVSLEGQLGVIYNDINSIAGSADTDARLTQVPFMANLRFQLPTGTPWTPYIGGGCGVTVNSLDFHQATVQGVALNGNDDATAFAYQAFAGIDYRLQPRMDISVGYEFLGEDRSEWDLQPTGTLILRHAYTHAIMASFTYRF